MLEQHFPRSRMISRGNLMSCVDRPIAGALAFVTRALLPSPLIGRLAAARA